MDLVCGSADAGHANNSLLHANEDDKDYSERMVQAKKLARSELLIDEWQRNRFQDLDLEQELGPALENCDRINCREFTAEEFVQRYEIPCRPCVIEGLVDNWPAKDWTFDQLSEHFGNACLKCGEDDDGNKVKMKLAYFMRYLKQQTDDSPMYVFDEFGDDTLLEEGEADTKPLLGDYTVPEYFPEDLMQYLGEEVRPPFRWLLIGPERSGSSVHIDPCCTSAWNAVIRGHKRWVLFPPSTPKTILKPAHWLQRPDRQAIDWFLRELPAIRAALPPHQQPLELVTGPGATMFVPTNWWHAVLNLDDTLAVTQNFCSSANFPAVYAGFRTARAKLSRAWLRALDRAGRDDLVAVAAAVAGGGCRAPLSRAQETKRRKNGIAALHRNAPARAKSGAFAQWRAWLGEVKASAAATGSADELVGVAAVIGEAAAVGDSQVRASPSALALQSRPCAAAARASVPDGPVGHAEPDSGSSSTASSGVSRGGALPSKWLRAR